MQVAQYSRKGVVYVILKFVGLLLYVCNVIIIPVYAYETNNAAYFVVVQIEVALTAPATFYSPGTKETPVNGRTSVGKAYQSAGVLAARVGYYTVKNSYKKVVISGFLFYFYSTLGKDNLSVPGGGGTTGVNKVSGSSL